MPKFRKKPVVIEAILFDGENAGDILKWFDSSDPPGCGDVHSTRSEEYISIATLESEIKVSQGDWVIRGVKGEFYPCKPDIFSKTYEPVEASI